MIPKSEYPIWIKEGQYDIFLLYSEYDTKEALNFADFLQYYMGRRVCLLHNYQNVQWKRNKFNSLEDAVSRSLFTFIYVTQQFVDDKKWGEYKQNATLAYSIEHEQDHVIPVNTDPTNIRMPFALNPLRSVNVGRIHDHFKPENYYRVEPQESTLNKSSTSSIIEDSPVHALSVLKAQIERLIGTKEEQRKLREVMYKKELTKWLPTEQLRRYEALLKEVVEKEQRKKHMEAEAQNIQERVLRQAQEPRSVPLQLSQESTPTNAPQSQFKEAANLIHQLRLDNKQVNITINVPPPNQTVINAPNMHNVQIGDGNQMGVTQMNQQQADSGITTSGEFSPEGEYYFYVHNLKIILFWAHTRSTSVLLCAYLNIYFRVCWVKNYKILHNYALTIP